MALMYSWIFFLSLAERGITHVSSTVSAPVYPTRFTIGTLNALHVLIHDCLRVMPANYLAGLLVKRSIEAPLVRSPRSPLHLPFQVIQFRASCGTFRQHLCSMNHRLYLLLLGNRIPR